MRVLVIEDEDLAAERLTGMLGKCTQVVEVAGVCESVRETLAWLGEKPAPDLLFMDIQLSDGHAFEILRQRPIEIPIIFTTAFDQYAIRAFKYNSIDYLLKPFTLEDLQAAIDKYGKQSIRKVITEESLLALEKMSQELKKHYKRRFFVKAKDMAYTVSSSEIALFNHEDGSTMLYKPTTERYLVNYSLDELETLMDPLKFFRINRQQLINIDSILKIDMSIKGRLYVNIDCPRMDGPLTVSKHRVHEFKVWLEG